MSSLDPRLSRLFRAASREPRPLPDSVPFGFETRVLAHWRSAAQDLSMAPFFRRAFLVCSAVMLLAAAFSYSTWTSAASNTELCLADSAIEISLP